MIQYRLAVCCNSCRYNDQLIATKASYFICIVFDFIAGIVFGIINVEITLDHMLFVICKRGNFACKSF